MRRASVVLLLLVSLAARSDPPANRLEGEWQIDERKSVVAFTPTAGGRWRAVTTSSPRSEEVGKPAFQDLVYRPAEGVFTGTLLMPENGSTHDVTVRFVSADVIEAVVKKFFLSKTITLVRVKEAARPQQGTP